MQIYLLENGQQEGPFGLARIVARLVSGELNSATPAWREGLDNWYPLYHDLWKEAGINAPAPQVQPKPVEDVAPASESELEAAQETASEAESEQIQKKIKPEQSPGKDSSPGQNEQAGEADARPEEPTPGLEPELSDESFVNYSQDDFKPPSYDEMEKEMYELRVKREKFPELIGRQAYESGLRNEELEEAWGKVEETKAQGKESELHAAFSELGHSVMAAGITDPSLDELKEEEQSTSDRMLNLQMQLRRMGGGDRVKKPSPWRKWIILLIIAIAMGGLISGLVLYGNFLGDLISAVVDYF